MDNKKMNRIWVILVILTFCVAVIVFSVWYVQKEQFLYFWDFVTNQKQVQYLGRNLKSPDYPWLSDLISSVRYDDYNLLPIYPLVLPLYLFGNSRLVFILSIICCYVFPFMLVMSWVFKQKYSLYKDNLAMLVCLGVIMLLPQVWTPIFRGYVDADAMLCVALIFLLNPEKPATLNLVKQILVGVICALLIVVRRYFAYWVIVYVAIMIADYLICLVRFSENKIKTAQTIFWNFSIFLSSLIWTLFMLGGGQIFSRLAENYQYKYSAYKSLIFFESISGVGRYFGNFIILLVSLSSVFLILNPSYRNRLWRLFLQSILPISLLFQVQDPNIHHYYLVLPSLIIIIAFFIDNHIRRSGKYRLGFVVLLGLGVINFWITYRSVPQNFVTTWLFNQEKYPPLVRNDLAEFQKLITYFDKIYQTDSGQIYVLASSKIVNEIIFRQACEKYAINGNICLSIQPTSDVDKRDGFPQRIFNAKYILISNPVQLHLRPDDQRVISEIDRRIKTKLLLGKYYDIQTPVFILDENTTMNVAKRNNLPIESKDVQDLIDNFQKWYPENKDLFHFPDINLNVY